MVAAVVAMVTRVSIAPGVQAGSGRPAWLTHPVVFVRAAGVQTAVTMVGSGTAAISGGTVVGARVGAAAGCWGGAAVGAWLGADVGARVGAAATGRVGAAVGGGSVGGGFAAGAHALRPSTVAAIMERTSPERTASI